MRIGIYDPYLDTMSGGEKYMLSVAKSLSREHDVSIFWDPFKKEDIVQKAKSRFDFDLSVFSFTENIFSPAVSFGQRFRKSTAYDYIILLSDGSIPFLACSTILHFQSPVEWVQPTIKTKIKIKRINHIICNSHFTKSFIDRKFGVKSTIIYPPVSFPENKAVKKQKKILHVGRYGINHTGSSYKKQEVLLSAFEKMVDTGLSDWELVFVMSVLEKDEGKLAEIKEAGKKYPVRFISNPKNDELWRQYAEANIYWHASGFGEDLEKHPDRAEHFGISTVEAMGMGAVPVVINAGGQKEIVLDQENGFLWSSIDELIARTKHLIDNPSIMSDIAQKAKLRAKEFSLEEFEKKILEIIT